MLWTEKVWFGWGPPGRTCSSYKTQQNVTRSLFTSFFLPLCRNGLRWDFLPGHSNGREAALHSRLWKQPDKGFLAEIGARLDLLALKLMYTYVCFPSFLRIRAYTCEKFAKERLQNHFAPNFSTRNQIICFIFWPQC